MLIHPGNLILGVYATFHAEGQADSVGLMLTMLIDDTQLSRHHMTSHDDSARGRIQSVAKLAGARTDWIRSLTHPYASHSLSESSFPIERSFEVMRPERYVPCFEDWTLCFEDFDDDDEDVFADDDNADEIRNNWKVWDQQDGWNGKCTGCDAVGEERVDE
jgi:hypothetical protein